MASFSSSPSLSLTNTEVALQDHFIIVVVKSKHNTDIFFIVVVVGKGIIRGKCETLTNDQGMRTDLMPHRWYFSRKHYKIVVHDIFHTSTTLLLPNTSTIVVYDIFRTSTISCCTVVKLFDVQIYWKAKFL